MSENKDNITTKDTEWTGKHAAETDRTARHMAADDTPENKKSGRTGRIIIALLVLIAVASYFAVPSVHEWVNNVVDMFKTGNFDDMREFIAQYGKWAMAISFFLMIFQSIAAPLPAFFITLTNANLFGWWQGCILSWASAMAGAAVILSVALKLLASIPSEDLYNAATSLAEVTFVILGMLTLLSVAMGAGVKGAAMVGTLLALSVAILAITASLSVLCGLAATGTLWTAVGALSALIAVLGLFAAVVGAIPGASLAVLMLSAAFLAIGVSVILAAVGFSIFVSSLALLGTVAPGIALSIAEAMDTLGKAVEENGANAGLALLALVAAAIGFGVALGIAGTGALAAAAGIGVLIVAVAAAFAIISYALSTFQDVDFEAIGTGIVGGIVNGIIGGISSAASTLRDVGSSIVSFITGGMDNSTETIETSARKLSKAAIDPMDEISTETEKKAEETSNVWTDAFGENGTISNTVNDFVDTIQEKAGDGMGLFADALGVGAEGGSEAFSGNLDLNDAIQNTLGGMNGDASDYLSQFTDMMGGGAIDATSLFNGGFDVSTAGETEMTGLLDQVSSSDLGGISLTKATEGKSGMESGLKGTDALGRGAANNLVSGVRSVDVSGPGRGAGSGIVSGMIAGLNALAPSVYARAAEIARNAANQAKAGAQVNSPSKITIPVGEGIAEGIMVGMSNMAAHVNAAGKDLGRNASLAVQAAGSTLDLIDWFSHNKSP